MNDSSASEKSRVSEKIAPKKRKKVTLTYLQNAGAYYLERFSASETQFRRVLTRKIDLSCKDYPEQSREDCLELLEQVILKFRTLGYLNDSLYIDASLRALKNRGFSRTRILNTLHMKGVDKALTAHINSTFPADYDRAAALRYIKRKKMGPYRMPNRQDQVGTKELATLARAGFSYDIAQCALQMSFEEAEIALNGFLAYTAD